MVTEMRYLGLHSSFLCLDHTWLLGRLFLDSGESASNAAQASGSCNRNLFLFLFA